MRDFTVKQQQQQNTLVLAKTFSHFTVKWTFILSTNMEGNEQSAHCPALYTEWNHYRGLSPLSGIRN